MKFFQRKKKESINNEQNIQFPSKNQDFSLDILQIPTNMMIILSEFQLVVKEFKICKFLFNF